MFHRMLCWQLSCFWKGWGWKHDFLFQMVGRHVSCTCHVGMRSSMHRLNTPCYVYVSGTFGQQGSNWATGAGFKEVVLHFWVPGAGSDDRSVHVLPASRLSTHATAQQYRWLLQTSRIPLLSGSGYLHINPINPFKLIRPTSVPHRMLRSSVNPGLGG